MLSSQNAANTDIKGFVNKVFGQNRGVVDQAKNCEALVNVIKRRTDKSRPRGLMRCSRPTSRMLLQKKVGST